MTKDAHVMCLEQWNCALRLLGFEWPCFNVYLNISSNWNKNCSPRLSIKIDLKGYFQ